MPEEPESRDQQEELPPGAKRAAEGMGELLHEAGLLDSPGEAREWIEETKDDMREADADA